MFILKPLPLNFRLLHTERVWPSGRKNVHDKLGQQAGRDSLGTRSPGQEVPRRELVPRSQRAREKICPGAQHTRLVCSRSRQSVPIRLHHHHLAQVHLEQRAAGYCAARSATSRANPILHGLQRPWRRSWARLLRTTIQHGLSTIRR